MSVSGNVCVRVKELKGYQSLFLQTGAGRIMQSAELYIRAACALLWPKGERRKADARSLARISACSRYLPWMPSRFAHNPSPLPFITHRCGAYVRYIVLRVTTARAGSPLSRDGHTQADRWEHQMMSATRFVSHGGSHR